MALQDVFEGRFGAKPAVETRAPGRVNLIGEHIDYSGGHVMPVAIAPSVRFAAAPREDGFFRLYSVQFDALWEGDRPTERTEDDFWVNYVFGVIAEFEKLGHAVPGLDAVVDGDVPRGSGLSSSAAFEVAVAWALQGMLGTHLSRMEIACLAQRAENHYVGVNCGIMDQAISAGGKAGHAMLLDCASLEAEHIPLRLGDKAAVLVAHSGVHRGLSSSAYNQRRGKCEEALRVVQRETGRRIDALCQATTEDLKACEHAMDAEMLKRARHAVGEEERVARAAEAMRSGDFKSLGELLNASHFSLRDDYEVSCEELDALTEMVRNHPGAYGSRLTGAGFGGSTVSLLRAEAAESVMDLLRKEYYAARGMEPVLFTTGACEGVETV